MKPVAWAIFAENGNIRMWSETSEAVEKLAEREGLTVTPLYSQDGMALAERLASDALTSLAGIVCTPVEGYLLAPQCLPADIRTLRKRCETIETTVRTFLHDLDAHEKRVQPSEIKMNSAMWMQVEAFRKLLAESV